MSRAGHCRVVPLRSTPAGKLERDPAKLGSLYPGWFNFRGGTELVENAGELMANPPTRVFRRLCDGGYFGVDDVDDVAPSSMARVQGDKPVAR